MQDNSWVKLYRKITEWEWYSHAPTRDLFIHLLLTVNPTETRYMGHIIPKGAAVYGRKELAVLLGFSEQSVRTAIEHLKSTNEITIRTTNKFSIIQIVRWKDYQRVTNKSTNNQPTTNQQLTTDKEYKNIEYKILDTVLTDNNLSIANDENFENFWRAYPKQRAGAKDKARTAWKNATKKVKPEILIHACERYAKSDEVLRGYAKGCAAWLNDERWTTDYTTKPKTKSGTDENRANQEPDQETINIFMGK